jgi:2-polyprenyl-3-methyl-5-hydroxy-6-metoxy-1,4-benzoquinol methylase
MEESDVNRRYFVHYVQQVATKGAKVLDFGCGDGTVVGMLRRAGYDAYGADIRELDAVGDGGSVGSDQGLLRHYAEGERLPFDDDTFDLVISNQVFEHVMPLEATVRRLSVS